MMSLINDYSALMMWFWGAEVCSPYTSTSFQSMVHSSFYSMVTHHTLRACEEKLKNVN